MAGPSVSCLYPYPLQVMNEDQTQRSAWPEPPAYYKRYTAENVEKLREAKKTGIYPDDLVVAPPLPPDHLRSLEPPSPPTDQYQVFDQTWEVHDHLRTLTEQGVPQFFPSGPIDRIQELKKLNRVLIVQFLDLLNVLVHEPEAFGQRIERISYIFINMHHILNEYRPHQARETLRLLMENQLTRKRQQAAELRRKSAEMMAALKVFAEEVGSDAMRQSEPMEGVQ
ncbi:Mediator of RNA polymerase II transcription subunit 7 [Apophysomyces ossiformis]|uniref:Mediator of RNA polymerase II transcription subunit 7 n=1 Tax=Apophysomyces ossiformis TaxID=679940 RepID=A0A8H7BLN8_9FUNG|nr:Mediator of RNA polymerase II transcription subunit 7 [Apophysomyces ossiformis]